MDTQAPDFATTHDTADPATVVVAGVQIAHWEPAQSGQPLTSLVDTPSPAAEPDAAAVSGNPRPHPFLSRLRSPFAVRRSRSTEPVAAEADADDTPQVLSTLDALGDISAVPADLTESRTAERPAVQEGSDMSSGADVPEPDGVTDTDLEDVRLPLPEPVPTMLPRPFVELDALRRRLLANGQAPDVSQSWRVKWDGKVWRLSFYTGRWYRRTLSGWVESAPPSVTD